MKTNKSYSKRLKVTKNGKVLSRKTGQNHFNAKATGTERLKKKKTAPVAMTAKAKARFLKK
jgi:ribosomal protein L35